MVEHFLTMLENSEQEVMRLLELAWDLKKGKCRERLEGKTLAMLFEKASTRTRISFEVAMTQLGGHAIFLDFSATQISRGESLSDTAKVLSRYCDAIMARLYKHSDAEEIALASSVPVINGLTDLFHPCQTAADMLTVLEKKGKIPGLKIAFFGDCGFNMFNSTAIGFSKLGADVAAVCPDKKEYSPGSEMLEKIKKQAKGKILVEHDAEKGAKEADVLYTDVWVSMGQKNPEQRINDLKPYQINSNILKRAKRDAIVLHCLPAHRGQEITDEVIDGTHSVVFDQAENRLHAQKAILLHLLKGI